MKDILQARRVATKSIRSGCLSLLISLLAGSPLAAQTRPHLCHAGEVPAFSCATGNKIVSLCASTGLDATTGSLIYRFGTRKRIELTYPAAEVRPQQAFRRGVGGYTGGGADFLRFRIGDTSYVLYSDYYRGRESDGLVIERGGKTIATRRCRTPALDGAEGWLRIYKAGLPDDEADFDVPGVRAR